ncbi:MAG TPA: fused MFS/spermidine synthase [Usitatibacter sp.]|nr:fused MFS/spermidine synthase [Usitatibacter sp.]
MSVRTSIPSPVTIRSPFRGDRGRVKLLEPPGTDFGRIREQLLDGTYPKPFVLEEQGARSLHFSRSLVQSGMRLDAPWALEFAYTRQMMAFLLFVPEPREILVLGLGGGSLVKYCHRHLPRANLTVVEIDPHVIAFRDEFRVPPDDERLRVRLGDAAEHVARMRAGADVILMDAFDRDGAAPSLSARDFHADAHAALAKHGVLVANLVGEDRRRMAHLEHIHAAFGANVILVPVEEDGNHIAFAFRDPAFEPRWRWIESRAHAMRKRHGLDFPRMAAMLERSRKLGYARRALRAA